MCGDQSTSIVRPHANCKSVNQIKFKISRRMDALVCYSCVVVFAHNTRRLVVRDDEMAAADHQRLGSRWLTGVVCTPRHQWHLQDEKDFVPSARCA